MADAPRIPVVPQPSGDVRSGPDLRDAARATLGLPLSRAADQAQRLGYESGARACGRRAVLADRLARLRARRSAVRPARRRGGDLALLRSAPVRPHLLAALARMELRRRSPARELLPEAAQGPAVLHRQHRPPSRPPPQREDPQLQPPTRSRPGTDLSQRADGLARGRAAGDAPQAVGRGRGTTGDVAGTSTRTDAFGESESLICAVGVFGWPRLA